MTKKRKIEIFSAGCPLCEAAVTYLLLHVEGVEVYTWTTGGCACGFRRIGTAAKQNSGSLVYSL